MLFRLCKPAGAGQLLAAACAGATRRAEGDSQSLLRSLGALTVVVIGTIAAALAAQLRTTSVSAKTELPMLLYY